MTNFSRYLLCLLFALVSLRFSTAGSSPITDIRNAADIVPEEAVFSDLVPLPSSGDPVSLGNSGLIRKLSKGKFLIAGRQLKDPRFLETVILLIHHDSDGTAGLIVNLPTSIKLSDLVPEIKEQPGKEHFTYIGGPVGMNQVLLLLRSRNKPEGCQWIFDDVYVSASRSVLEQLINKPSAETTFRAYAGYAGWGAGQLEREVLQGAWQIAGADAEVIFKKPSSEIWKDLNREEDSTYIEL